MMNEVCWSLYIQHLTADPVRAALPWKLNSYGFISLFKGVLFLLSDQVLHKKRKLHGLRLVDFSKTFKTDYL